MWFSMLTICTAVIMFSATPVVAETNLFHGKLDIVTGSGKLCEGFLKQLPISLVLDYDNNESGIIGYFEGEGLSIGKFTGDDLNLLSVVYPYNDPETATGHRIVLTISNSLLVGELREKHMDESAEVCSFDLARLNLQLVAKGKPARDQLQKVAKLFDAELANSKALALIRKNEYEKAMTLFQKALEQASTEPESSRFLLDSSIAGLASCYFRRGLFTEFNKIYDERFSSVTGEWFKSIMNKQRIIVQLHIGREAVKSGEFDKALNILLPAYKLNVQSMETIGYITTSFLKTGRFIEAISFIEQAAPKLELETDRRAVVGMIAMVNFIKAKSDEKEGREIEAAADLRKAVFLNPDVPSYWIALARLLHKSGSFEEANTVLQEGLEHFKDESAHMAIVAALEKMQQIETIMKSVR